MYFDSRFSDQKLSFLLKNRGRSCYTYLISGRYKHLVELNSISTAYQLNKRIKKHI